MDCAAPTTVSRTMGFSARTYGAALHTHTTNRQKVGRFNVNRDNRDF